MPAFMSSSQQSNGQAKQSTGVFISIETLEQLNNLNPNEFVAAVWSLYEIEQGGADIETRIRKRLSLPESVFSVIRTRLRNLGIQIPERINLNQPLGLPPINGFPKMQSIRLVPISSELLSPTDTKTEVNKSEKKVRKTPVWQPYFDRLLFTFGQTYVYKANPSHKIWNRWRKVAKDFGEFVNADGQPLDLDVIDRCYKRCVDAKFGNFGPEALLNRLPDVLKSQDVSRKFLEEKQRADDPAEKVVSSVEPIDPFFARIAKPKT